MACELIQLTETSTAFICGAPDECDHIWDGEWRYWHHCESIMESEFKLLPESEQRKYNEAGCTCSKCGCGFEVDYNMF